MKAPRPKIHLADRDSPILDYSNVEVRCGTVLQNGLPKFMFADGLEHDVKIPGLCVRCERVGPIWRNSLDMLKPKPPGMDYLYGLVEAQEERDAERQAES